jgi:hypothetical protein
MRICEGCRFLNCLGLLYASDYDVNILHGFLFATLASKSAPHP